MTPTETPTANRMGFAETLTRAPAASVALTTAGAGAKLYTPEVRQWRTPAPLFHVKGSWLPEDVDNIIRHYDPRSDLGRLIVRLGKMRNVDADLRGEILEAVQRSVVLQSSLAGIKYHGDRRQFENLGELSRKVVTTAGVNYWVDAWQNSVEMEDMRYHGFGSGTTAEATGQTALVTEYTTEYVTNSTRPTGSLTEGASANIFRTVATFAPDSGGTLSVGEHGIFSQAATGGGTMWDRSLTGTVSLVASSDSLQVTYDMTATAGG